MRAREFIIESFIVESYPLARAEFIRAATAKFGLEAVAKIGTKDEPEEITKEIDNVKKALDQHRELAKKNQFKNPDEKDINYWRRQGWEAFSAKVKDLSSQKTSTQINRGKAEGKAIILQDDANWTVLIPLDKEASVYYGKATQWCTTKPYQSYYEQYVYDDKIILIYAIPKNKESDSHVAISLYPDDSKKAIEFNKGKPTPEKYFEMFNKADDKIEAQEYTQISGLDPRKFVQMADQSENRTQVDTARTEFLKLKDQATALINSDEFNQELLERLLKVIKDRQLCALYVIKYSEYTGGKVTVDPTILIATANHVHSGHDAAKKMGQYIDFTKIPNKTFKTIINSSPSLLVFNANYLSADQIKMFAPSAEASYLYAKYVTGKPFPEGEKAIATNAEYSYGYALDVLHNRFPEGEPAIQNSKYSMAYDKYTAYIPPPIDPEEIDLYRTSMRVTLKSPSDVKTTEYWMTSYSQQIIGPFSANDILDKIKKRQINPDGEMSIVWRIGLDRWVPLKDLIPEIDPSFVPPTPQGEKLPPEKNIYYYSINNTPIGPVTRENLLKLLDNKSIDTQTPIFKDGYRNWKPLGELMGELKADRTPYFYLVNNQKHGPVTAAELLHELSFSWSQVNDETKVWRPGLKNWQPLSTIKRELSLPPESPKPPPMPGQPPPLAPDDKIYYYVINNTPTGPVTRQNLFNLLNNNTIDNQTQVWRKGLEIWQPLSSLLNELNKVQTESRRRRRVV